MEIQEEYWGRRRLSAPLVKYVDHGSLILRGRVPGDSGWASVSITSVNDGTHPQKYVFTVSQNPVAYSTPDLSHTILHSNLNQEMVWEWDQYESGILAWAQGVAGKYTAVPAEDAIFVAWEMFAANYDAWMARFLPYRMQEELFRTLQSGRESRIEAIKAIEEYLKGTYDRVLLSWKGVRSAVDQKNYSDWLARVVNGMAAA